MALPSQQNNAKASSVFYSDQGQMKHDVSRLKHFSPQLLSPLHLQSRMHKNQVNLSPSPDSQIQSGMNKIVTSVVYPKSAESSNKDDVISLNNDNVSQIDPANLTAKNPFHPSGLTPDKNGIQFKYVVSNPDILTQRHGSQQKSNNLNINNSNQMISQSQLSGDNQDNILNSKYAIEGKKFSLLTRFSEPNSPLIHSPKYQQDPRFNRVPFKAVNRSLKKKKLTDMTDNMNLNSNDLSHPLFKHSFSQQTSPTRLNQTQKFTNLQNKNLHKNALQYLSESNPLRTGYAEPEKHDKHQITNYSLPRGLHAVRKINQKNEQFLRKFSMQSGTNIQSHSKVNSSQNIGIFKDQSEEKYQNQNESSIMQNQYLNVKLSKNGQLNGQRLSKSQNKLSQDPSKYPVQIDEWRKQLKKDHEDNQFIQNQLAYQRRGFQGQKLKKIYKQQTNCSMNNFENMQQNQLLQAMIQMQQQQYNQQSQIVDNKRVGLNNQEEQQNNYDFGISKQPQYFLKPIDLQTAPGILNTQELVNSGVKLHHNYPQIDVTDVYQNQETSQHLSSGDDRQNFSSRIQKLNYHINQLNNQDQESKPEPQHKIESNQQVSEQNNQRFKAGSVSSMTVMGGMFDSSQNNRKSVLQKQPINNFSISQQSNYQRLPIQQNQNIQDLDIQKDISQSAGFLKNSSTDIYDSRDQLVQKRIVTKESRLYQGSAIPASPSALKVLKGKVHRTYQQRMLLRDDPFSLENVDYYMKHKQILPNIHMEPIQEIIIPSSPFQLQNKTGKNHHGRRSSANHIYNQNIVGDPTGNSNQVWSYIFNQPSTNYMPNNNQNPQNIQYNQSNIESQNQQQINVEEQQYAQVNYMQQNNNEIDEFGDIESQNQIDDLPESIKHSNQDKVEGIQNPGQLQLKIQNVEDGQDKYNNYTMELSANHQSKMSHQESIKEDLMIHQSDQVSSQTPGDLRESQNSSNQQQSNQSNYNEDSMQSDNNEKNDFQNNSLNSENYDKMDIDNQNLGNTNIQYKKDVIGRKSTLIGAANSEHLNQRTMKRLNTKLYDTNFQKNKDISYNNQYESNQQQIEETDESQKSYNSNLDPINEESNINQSQFSQATPLEQNLVSNNIKPSQLTHNQQLQRKPTEILKKAENYQQQTQFGILQMHKQNTVLVKSNSSKQAMHQAATSNAGQIINRSTTNQIQDVVGLPQNFNHSAAVDLQEFQEDTI
eukprot:403337594